MKIPVIVVGPNGKKLGRPVVSALAESEECELIGGGTNPKGGFAQQIVGGVAVAGSFSALLRGPSLVISLSNTVVFYAVKPEALLARVKEAVREGFRIHVIGTTGLSAEEMSELGEMAKDGQHRRVIVQTSNFSVGANVGAEQCAVLARQFPDADVEIVEAHHNQKADAPSGTALYWARAIAGARGYELEHVIAYGRSGRVERVGGEICIHSLRGGSVTGNHQATFFCPDDEISVEHNARSSALFAQGALRVIRWAPDVVRASSVDTSMERRLYHMYDVLDLPLIKELGVY